MTQRPTDPAQEPIGDFMERLVNGAPISRRTVLQRFAAAGLTAGSASALLAACGGVEGTNEGKGDVDVANVSHPKVDLAGKTITVSNWPLYIDEKTVGDWQKATGGKMKYLEDYNDNEEFYAKVRQELETGKPIGRAMVMPTDWMAARWIDQGYAEPIDKKNVPNAKNLIDSLKSPPFDKNRDFTLPWQSGMTAVGYNPQKTGRKLTSINDLFDPKFKGRVTMLTEWRDSAGLVLLGMGKDPSTASKEDYQEAIAKIGEESDKGQIRRFTGNDYAKDLASGSLWACVAWSGDIVQLQPDNPHLEFLIPEEGAMTWSDNMLLPAKESAADYYAAETFMNFVYEPEHAAQITAYVNYFCPVKGSKEIVLEKDPDLANNQLIFPDEETLSQLHAYPKLTLADERELTAEMQKVTGA